MNPVVLSRILLVPDGENSIVIHSRTLVVLVSKSGLHCKAFTPPCVLFRCCLFVCMGSGQALRFRLSLTSMLLIVNRSQSLPVILHLAALGQEFFEAGVANHACR